MTVDSTHISLINLIISLFGFIILYSAWSNLQKNEKPKDKGYYYLSLALLIWSILFSYSFFFAKFCPDHIDGWIKSSLSTVNNGLILYSMIYFDFRPDRIPRKKIWQYISLTTVAVVFLFSSFLFLYPDDMGDTAYMPDVTFSLCILGLLGYIFFVSFKRRNFIFLSYLTLIVVLSLSITQFLTLDIKILRDIKDNNYIYLIDITSHMGLVLIFITSIFGWFIQRTLPDVKYMKLKFKQIPDTKLSVWLTVDSVFRDVLIPFTKAPALYLYLLKFAVRKKYKDEGFINTKDVKQDKTPGYRKRVLTRIQSKKDGHGESENKIRNVIMEDWPFLFEKIQHGRKLILLQENIEIEPDLIRSLHKHPIIKSLIENASTEERKQEIKSTIKLIQDEFESQKNN